MKFLRRWLVAMLALSCLVACGNSQETSKGEGKGLKIVTSFYPIYAITKAVSGDLNEVRMIQSGSGIHDFEPSVADVAAIYDADLFVYHSRTLESWAGKLDPNAQKSKVQVVEASKDISLDRVEGLEDVKVEEGIDEKTLYDPHSWLDPVKAGEEAEAIAGVLAARDPQHKKVYEDNAKRFKEEANRLVDKYQGLLKGVKEKTFVTQHTAFSYLAKRFGLVQLGIAGISPEQEPSAKKLSEIQDFLKENHIRKVFVERNQSSKIAKVLGKSLDAKISVLDPLEADPENEQTYLENLEDNLKTLVKELK